VNGGKNGKIIKKRKTKEGNINKLPIISKSSLPPPPLPPHHIIGYFRLGLNQIKSRIKSHQQEEGNRG
jgi:hypothetical protein